MNTSWRMAIWRQFGAAIDDLNNAIATCPDELWHTRLWEHPEEQPELSQFWYQAYHAIFWLDVYLTGTEEGFLPPPPFSLIEQDEHGPVPEQAYTKDELMSYLDSCRNKCRATIEALTDEAAESRCRFGWGEVSFEELLLYNMRHVQGHTAQLHLLLGQKMVVTPNWVLSAVEQG